RSVVARWRSSSGLRLPKSNFAVRRRSPLQHESTLSPVRILRVPWRGSHLSAWLSACSLLSASSTTFFILLSRRNQLLHATCQVVHPGARPWRTSTPLLPIIEFP